MIFLDCLGQPASTHTVTASAASGSDTPLEPRRLAIDDPLEALAYRASLPGASGYDAAAHAIEALLASCSSPLEELRLVPLALPTSWLVNSTATSRTFRALRAPQAMQAWEAILTLLPREMPIESWLAEEEDVKLAVSGFLRLLCEVEGSSLAAVSKVFSLLRPRLFPLLDDAAVALALGLVPTPSRADTPSAPWACALPMLTWFGDQVRQQRAALDAVAHAHAQATSTPPLEAAQVFDRLLWVVSWGDHLRGRERHG